MKLPPEHPTGLPLYLSLSLSLSGRPTPDGRKVTALRRGLAARNRKQMRSQQFRSNPSP